MVGAVLLLERAHALVEGGGELVGVLLGEDLQDGVLEGMLEHGVGFIAREAIIVKRVLLGLPASLLAVIKIRHKKLV